MRNYPKIILSALAILYLALMSNKSFCQTLIGTYRVQCANRHKPDTVRCGTSSHYCNYCFANTFTKNQVAILCPRNHSNLVTGLVQQKHCNTCNKECRIDQPFVVYDKDDSRLRSQFDNRDCR